ncbi:DNA repair protein RecO [Clostridium tagluense]|uniref:DNA repair protein RecO n=1 Tax=Clostridium tagluense TaxID=360422 RepID=UPI001C0B0D54|nr:DNA repair protein RecO [Clostridium tagluense]MBU3128464.1 DNA repair protein RecO [Clostridium tagluense]MCB2310099.1 DNA repair protein RecO [Clostridium tagluense]MCB2314371.1 DNA repair protein RecO [Clostridium tagluense]MCB2319217.1 DNA repair protein RecO [Clostridium tagluense]MCB2324693.1 DNA repair protein RecO [Clostridium tagluense]
MSILKTRAIVIKTQEFKESDKLVWLFTEELGKITAIAKGARKNKSKYVSSTLPCSYGEFILFKGKNLYTINEVTIIDSFQQLLRDLTTITYASYFNELIDISMENEEVNSELFKDFVSAFYFIKNDVMDIEVLARAFETKLLKATGYGLNFEQCVRCRKKITISNNIDLQSYGPICKDCEKVNSIYISNPTYNTLKFLNNFGMDKINRIVVSKASKLELYKILSFIISQNYTRKPKSLEMFDQLREYNN